jgi:hypothetical protein
MIITLKVSNIGTKSIHNNNNGLEAGSKLLNILEVVGSITRNLILKKANNKPIIKEPLSPIKIFLCPREKLNLR